MMDDKIKAALTCLGFEESVKVEKVPKLKVVTKMYHKLALKHHPDRPGENDDELFKKITEAYRFICEYLEELIDEKEDEPFDYEEEVARRTFKQFEFAKVKENMRSFTIHIENNLSMVWDKILSTHYGGPLDRDENGFHWKVSNYTDGNLTGNIAIGKWHIPKKDGQSKLNIQSNERGNFLPAHFVDHVLPKLLQEVHNYKGIEKNQP